jgi:putative protease
MAKELVGKIAHYYNKIGVAVVELIAPLKEGDTISIESPERSFEQKVGSMQIEHEKISEAKPGQAVGLKVEEPVREGFQVYKVTEE